MQTNTEQMNASQVFCPNRECMARGQVGQGNIVSHGRKRPRYRCKICGKTFSAKEGTLFAGLRKPTEVIVQVVTLLAYGCPVQAIVHAFGLDERTVASWRDRAGAHGEQVHHALVEQGQLDLVHVQADEIRVKGRKLIAWMGLAMMVPTQLWLAGVVSATRDRTLADRLLLQVRGCARGVSALLVCTDGWAAYPGSIRRAFRKTGQSDRRARTSVLAGLAAVAHRHGQQTYCQVPPDAHHAADGAWDVGASRRTAGGLTGRQRAQYGVYRAVQWHDARAAGGLNAQMPSCGPATDRLTHGHVSAGLHLQFLLAASGVESLRSRYPDRQAILGRLYPRDGERINRSSLECL